MPRAIFIDKDRCVACYSCIVACKLEHSLPPHPVAPPVGNPEGPELVRVYQVGPKMLDDEVCQYFQPIPIHPALLIQSIFFDADHSGGLGGGGGRALVCLTCPHVLDAIRAATQQLR